MISFTSVSYHIIIYTTLTLYTSGGCKVDAVLRTCELPDGHASFLQCKVPDVLPQGIHNKVGNWQIFDHVVRESC